MFYQPSLLHPTHSALPHLAPNNTFYVLSGTAPKKIMVTPRPKTLPPTATASALPTSLLSIMGELEITIDLLGRSLPELSADRYLYVRRLRWPYPGLRGVFGGWTT